MLWRYGYPATVLGLLSTLSLASAHGAEVSLQVSSRETYVGVPIDIQLIISDPQQEPQPPTFPAIPGATVRFAGGPSRNSQMTIINGQMDQKVTLGYQYQLTPTKEGKLVIPPIVVEVDGKQLKTQPVAVVVTKSETGDLLLVDLKGKRKAVYVGEALDVTLQIWIRPFEDRNFHIKLSEGHLWSQINMDGSEWGPFLEVLQQLANRRQRPGGEETLRKDSSGNERAYYRYELIKTIYPERPGKLDIGNINIVMNYPVRLGRSRDIFSMSDLAITQIRPVSAQVQVEPIEIKAVPAKGQPPHYRGAVGQYTISASATPTEVAVGDPITLTLTVSGTGRLDVLPPPPLPDIAELAADFKIPTDPLAGTVQGSNKVFSQSIRAKSGTVQAIPAIPFAYFDPQQEKYVTVATKPIPIVVKGAEQLSTSRIVDAGSAPRPTRSLTEVSSGILANYNEINDLLGQQTFSPGGGTAIALLAPPLLFAAIWLIQRRRHRLRTDISFARRRAARRTAMDRIKIAAKSKQDAEQAAAIEAAMTGYIADRCNLPLGGLTRAEVTERLSERRVSGEMIKEVDQFLEQCETMRYAARLGAMVDSKGSDPADAAQRMIERLEKEKF